MIVRLHRNVRPEARRPQPWRVCARNIPTKPVRHLDVTVSGLCTSSVFDPSIAITVIRFSRQGVPSVSGSNAWKTKPVSDTKTGPMELPGSCRSITMRRRFLITAAIRGDCASVSGDTFEFSVAPVSEQVYSKSHAIRSPPDRKHTLAERDSSDNRPNQKMRRRAPATR